MDKKRPLVSVCVTTYQHVHYIKPCLDGILMQQTTFPFEIILGEDESNDGTREICIDYANKYPDKISLKLRHRRDVIYINGQATGRYNFIENLKAVRGTYIALCEGDDYWTDPLKLQKQIDILEANPECAICFHRVKILRGNNYYGDSKIESRFDKIENEPIGVLDLLQHGNFMHTPSVVFRNQNLDLPFEFNHAFAGDYFLHIINAQKGYIMRLKDFMAVYRDGIGIYSSLTSTKRLKVMLIYQACILSYLQDDNQKGIILKKFIEHIDKFEYQYSNSKHLAQSLSFKLLFKAVLVKIKSTLIR